MKLLRFLSNTLPFLFWLLLIFGFDAPKLAIFTLISAFIHEIGHIMLGASAGIKGIRAHTSGFRIKIGSAVAYKKEALLIAGGPLFNALTALISHIAALMFPANEYFPLFSVINLMTALSNLLPIAGYDGYKLLECAIYRYFNDTDTALLILNAFSFVFTTTLMFISLYLILKIGEGYWIFSVLFVSFLLKLKKSVTNGIF